MIRSILLALLVLGTSAGPQFGGFGIPKVEVPAAAADLGSSVPGAGSVLEWTQKIQDLVTLLKSALTDMGDIAVADNPEVGAKIVEKLTQQIAKAVQVFAEFTASSVPGGRRRREDKGAAAHNKVGTILVESNDNIQPEKGQLSPEAQAKIDARYTKALSECKAESCVSALEREKKLAAAKAAKKNG